MGRVRRTLAKISRNVLRVLIKVIRKIRAKIFSNGFTSFLRVCKTLEHKARFGKQLERPKRPKAKRTSCVFYLFAVICLGNKQSGRSAQDICAALKSMLWKSSERQWVKVGGGKCGIRGASAQNASNWAKFLTEFAQQARSRETYSPWRNYQKATFAATYRWYPDSRETEWERERKRGQARGEHDMKHNANVVVDNFINIKFCIHQSAASSPARGEAQGKEGRSVCRRRIPAPLLVLALLSLSLFASLDLHNMPVDCCSC